MTVSRTPSELARRSHSIMSAITAAFEVWYAVLGGIAAWTIHLLVLASIVQLTCNDPGYEWIVHATTGVTLLMVAVAIALSWRLANPPTDDAANTEWSRRRFLGVLGLIFGATNALLIGLEELYVFVLHPVRCG